MVKSTAQAKRIQSKREASGKVGIAVAVRRYLKRDGLTLAALR